MFSRWTSLIVEFKPIINDNAINGPCFCVEEGEHPFAWFCHSVLDLVPSTVQAMESSSFLTCFRLSPGRGLDRGACPGSDPGFAVMTARGTLYDNIIIESAKNVKKCFFHRMPPPREGDTASQSGCSAFQILACILSLCFDLKRSVAIRGGIVCLQ
jgi:hypothetical protein